MRVHLLVIPLLLVFGCATGTSIPTRFYQYTLDLVERQERGSERESSLPSGPNEFEDDLIRITWTPGVTQLEFALTNKTDSSLRVLWDDASYVSPDGTADRIMHRGVKFTGRSASMPPTLVVYGSTLEDLIAPVSNVSWREGFSRHDTGGWESKPLLTPGYDTGSVKVLLPLESEGRIYEYIFNFDVAATTVTAKKQSQIRILRKEEEQQVQQCELRGTIQAHPPYILPGDDYRQLRSKAAALGADTIFVPGYRVGIVTGYAYRCMK